MKRIQLLLAGSLLFSNVFAQETFPTNGVKDKKPNCYAFINATIVMDADNTLQNGTLIIKGQKIDNIGVGLPAPQGSVVIDLKGKYIYPGLVDVYSSYGLPDAPKAKGKDSPQFVSEKNGAFGWNEAIRPETICKDLFNPSDKEAEELRNLGFGAVVSVMKDGIARGTSAAVTLADKRANEVMLVDNVAANYSFSKGSSPQDFPSSQMGCIALLRQTYLDAKWYNANASKEEYNISLESFNKQQNLPQVFEVVDVLEIMRADKVGDEFGKQYIIKGAGDEYQRIAEVKQTGAALIVPIAFPKAYDVKDPDQAMQVSLTEMKHWELAPGNLAALEKAGIPFMITTAGLKDKAEFWSNMRLAIQYGLTEKTALKALTTVPAQQFKLNNQTGSLRKGFVANFIITSGKLFDKKTDILDNWVQGDRYTINELDGPDLRGNYTLNIESLPAASLKVGGEADAPEMNVVLSDTSKKAKASFSRSNNLFSLNFENKFDDTKGSIRLSGYLDGKNLKGTGELADGKRITWSATYAEAFKPEKEKPDSTKASLKIGSITYPFTAYGWTSEPKPEMVLFKNATVWTSEAQGKLEGTDVLIDRGKIAAIGRNLSASGAKVVDATGKHLTAGIIDEHSHIAVSKGVNDIQTVSSEVRIGDVLNSEDINIYRQLSGGVTTSHLLHGSANAIGGQTALIKLRWGASPEKLKFQGADGFIKFALGENVKQANWGDNQVTRYPQTRMGVEQVYVDAFTRAKEYRENMMSNPSMTRRDLELDALVEIMGNKRFITCHSYVQSEINMLMKVADSMGFKVNTFTHILEGYKVANKMRVHGATASTFSDWWAYKAEVSEAIPFNAAITTNQGVNTCINSDDAEMARRLNQEAAKTIKYGGMTEDQAFRMITINPAKALHIDNRTGSIKAGKDADLVLWSDNPLSIYAKVEKTFVDGIEYYDVNKDAQLREDIRNERARLIRKMMDAKSKGEKTQLPGLSEEELYICDTITDEAR